MLFVLILGNFWCSVENSVMFSSNPNNFENNPKHLSLIHYCQLQWRTTWVFHISLIFFVHLVCAQFFFSDPTDHLVTMLYVKEFGLHWVCEIC